MARLRVEGSRRTVSSRVRRAIASAAAIGAIAGSVVAVPGTPTAAATIKWVHELGSGSVDYATGVAVDAAGNTYVTGYTNGRVAGARESNVGGYDVFVAKYSRKGTRVWVHQFGGESNDYAYAIAVDPGGNAYITGYTPARVGAPELNAGDDDVFVAKFSTSGSRAWTHLLGSKATDYGYGIAVDHDGNAYVTGATQGRLPGAREAQAGHFDAFVAKYSKTGSRVWVHTLGSAGNDYGHGVAVDGVGNAYVAGITDGRLPGGPAAKPVGSDAFVAKYSTGGNRAWVRDLGSRGNDLGYGVAVDRTANAYVTGSTTSRLPGSTSANAGDGDAFIAKYSKTGARLWVHQLGSVRSDVGYGAGIDHAGSVYIAGATAGRLPTSPEPNAGGLDAFVAKYSAGGARQWVHQLGSPSKDEGLGIAVDPAGDTSVAGMAGRIPDAPEGNAGLADAFVARNP